MAGSGESSVVLAGAEVGAGALEACSLRES